MEGEEMKIRVFGGGVCMGCEGGEGKIRLKLEILTFLRHLKRHTVAQCTSCYKVMDITYYAIFLCFPRRF